MPNWCANNMVVQGKGEVVKQFIQENFKTDRNPWCKEGEYEYKYILDFEQFDPTPTDEDGKIINDWYNWRLQHWGCKWSPSYEQCISLCMEKEGEPVNIIYDDGRLQECNFTEELIRDLDAECYMKLELQCYFETPWGPPEGIFMQWYEKYKELDLEVSIKFYEPGVIFAGEIWFSKEGYCLKFIDDSDRKEWVEYLLKEGWEDIEWYIEECYDMIREMHSEEIADKLILKIEETLCKAKDAQAATLIADIMDKYMEWLHKPEGDESSESSEE